MKAISVVISSLRPDRLEQTVQNLESERDWIEVVVASPQAPMRRDFVRHVRVPAPGEPGELTFTQKFNLATAHADGTYVLYNNDDMHFTAGWAQPLIAHMEAAHWRPYLAALPIATRGVIVNRHTIFGLLYGNHGCIRKADLACIGGLLDERLFMYYSELDLAMRVWAAGGRVGICPHVVMHADRDTDHMQLSPASAYLTKEKPIARSKPSTYRDLWIRHDAEVFFDTWFRRYGRLFWRHYARLRGQLSDGDGVLPARWRDSGLGPVMFWPSLRILLSPRTSVPPRQRISRVKEHLVRVVNRRWGSQLYELPYDPRDVAAADGERKHKDG